MNRAEHDAIVALLQPRHRNIYVELCRAAKAGIPCPTNAALCDHFGGFPASMSYALDRLEKVGLITIERGQYSRRVTIAFTGKMTGGPAPATHWRFKTEEERVADAAKPRKGKKPATYETPENTARRAEQRLQAELEVEARRVSRDVCFACQVPFDKHAEFGCRKWRPRG